MLERAILYETCLSQCLEQGEWWSEFSCASALDPSPSACVSVSSVPSLRACVSTSLLVMYPQIVSELLRVRSKRFCAEDRSFLSEGGQFPFGKPLIAASDPFKDAESFRVRELCIYLSEGIKNSLSGMEGNSLL